MRRSSNLLALLLKGIKEGRDELLEAAVAYMGQQTRTNMFDRLRFVGLSAHKKSSSRKDIL